MEGECEAPSADPLRLGGVGGPDRQPLPLRRLDDVDRDPVGARGSVGVEQEREPVRLNLDLPPLPRAEPHAAVEAGVDGEMQIDDKRYEDLIRLGYESAKKNVDEFEEKYSCSFTSKSEN